LHKKSSNSRCGEPFTLGRDHPSSRNQVSRLGGKSNIPHNISRILA